jgi:hypothetical protein
VLEENSVMLLDSGMDCPGKGIVLGEDPKAQETKAQENKREYIKLKKVCLAKEAVEVRRQAVEWEGAFANHT